MLDLHNALHTATARRSFTAIVALSVIATLGLGACVVEDEDVSAEQVRYFEAVDAEAEHLSDEQLTRLYSVDIATSQEVSNGCRWDNMDTTQTPAYRQCFGGEEIIDGWVIYTGQDLSYFDWSFAFDGTAPALSQCAPDEIVAWETATRCELAGS